MLKNYSALQMNQLQEKPFKYNFNRMNNFFKTNLGLAPKTNKKYLRVFNKIGSLFICSLWGNSLTLN